MERTKIKANKWYETVQGVGEVVKAGGCHPWAALIRIVGPVPRGERWLAPREFICERPDIPERFKRALARFGDKNTCDSTTPPSQDLDMMCACDIGHFVTGMTPAGPDFNKRWVWQLTEKGKAVLGRDAIARGA